MNIRLLLPCTLLTCVVACGGDKKGPKSPESNAGITETSAKEDMPPPPAKEANAPTAADVVPRPPAGVAAGGMIKISAMKLAPTKKGKNDKVVELKADGTIRVDGKPAAKIKGDQVDSVEGTSMVTIGVDGSLVGNGVKPGFKFEGDDLTAESGVKLTVGDDGAITVSKDGKSDVLGKAEGGGSAKRAALIMAALYMTIPGAVGGDTAKPATAEKKPGTKTATPPTPKK